MPPLRGSMGAARILSINITGLRPWSFWITCPPVRLSARYRPSALEFLDHLSACPLVRLSARCRPSALGLCHNEPCESSLPAKNRHPVIPEGSNPGSTRRHGQQFRHVRDEMISPARFSTRIMCLTAHHLPAGQLPSVFGVGVGSEMSPLRGSMGAARNLSINITGLRPWESFHHLSACPPVRSSACPPVSGLWPWESFHHLSACPPVRLSACCRPSALGLCHDEPCESPAC